MENKETEALKDEDYVTLVEFERRIKNATTTIKIKAKTWKDLWTWRVYCKAKDLDSAINKLLKIAKQVELNKDNNDNDVETFDAQYYIDEVEIGETRNEK